MPHSKEARRLHNAKPEVKLARMLYRSTPEIKRKEAEYIKIRVRRIDAYKTGPCVDCNKCYNPWQMQFDHVPGRGIKTAEVSSLVNCSLSRIEEEIAKCDLVCANCHANRTYYRSRPPGVPNSGTFVPKEGNNDETQEA